MHNTTTGLGASAESKMLKTCFTKAPNDARTLYSDYNIRPTSLANDHNYVFALMLTLASSAY